MQDLAPWSLPVFLASTSLAVLWGHAALHKWLDLDAWRAQLAAYGAGRVGATVAVAALVLPMLETGLAVGLLGAWRMQAAWGSAVLLAVYALGMAQQVWLGRETDCGCGGMALPVSWPLVARNLVLVAWSAVAAQPASWVGGSLTDVIGLALALLSCVLLYTALHQVLRHRAWMRAQDLQRRGM